MARAAPLALATLAGLSAWLSLGALAVVDRSIGARVGSLPPWWLLAVFVAAGVGVVAWRGFSTRQLLPLALTILPCLPWLPGGVPPAFLIWYGPPAVLVWVLAIGGVLAPALGAVGRRRVVGSPEVAPWVAGLAAALMFAAGAVVLQPRLPSGDEPHYLIITQSLLTDHDLAIENNHARGDYYPYFGGELRPDYLRRGQDGQIYSIHAPGLSLMLAPAFALGGYPAAVVTMIGLSALGVSLLWLLVWRLTGVAAAAWAACGLWATSAPGYFHAMTLYPDGLGALGTIIGLSALVSLERRQTLGLGRLAATGLALAVLPWLHTRFALIAGVLGLAVAARLLGRADRVRAVGALMAIPLGFALAWFGYFWIIWGTPSPAAPYGHYTQGSWSNLAPGLPGVFLDQQFGLIPNAPLYALALVGIVALARTHPRLALEVALLVVPYTLAVASYRMWWGGFSAPARFLVAVLPAAALPLGILWTRSGAGLKAMALALLALGWALVIPRVVIDQGSLLYNSRDGVDLLLDWANRSVNLPLAWPSLHRDAPVPALVDAVWWLMSVALAGTLAAKLAARAGAAWLLACAALAFAAMGAATIVWNGQASRPLTPNSSALDLLHRWSSSLHTVGWQSRPFRLLPPAEVLTRLQLTSSSRTPARTSSPPLFTAPLVPAGDYELILSGAHRPGGELTVDVSRAGRPLDVVGLREGNLQPGRLVLELPVRVRSLTISGDSRARETVSAVALRPRLVRDSARMPGIAHRGALYGDTRVFFLDDDAFMEATGFWTRAEATTSLIVDTRRLGVPIPTEPPALTLRAGVVATTAIVSGDAWSQEFSFEPGQSHSLPLPASGAAEAWQIWIESGAGFRPGEHEPGSRDFRNLGVWVSVP